MSEPVTRTGKMLWSLTPAGSDTILAFRRDILAIEAEAREAVLDALAEPRLEEPAPRMPGREPW